MGNCLLVLKFFSLLTILKKIYQENTGGNQAGMKLFSWNDFSGCYIIIATLILALIAGIIDRNHWP